MARKRGGIAGLYDRNKGVIQAAAPVLAGMVGGPLAGAAVGAAMRGLDREGKSGIGFDVGQGIKGGLSGYGSGAAGAGLKNMFTGQVAKLGASRAAAKAGEAVASMPSATTVMPQGLAGLGSAAVPAPAAAGFDAAQYIAGQGPSQVASKAMTLGKGVTTTTPARSSLARAAGAVKDKAGSITGGIPDALKTKEGLGFAGSALQTGASILGSQAQAAQAQQEYDDQQQQLQARAEMMALFAPQMAGNLGMQFGGAGAPTASFQQYADSAADLGTDDPRVMREEQGEPIIADGRVIGYQRRSPLSGNPRPRFQMGTIASRR
jgi:hypothetical protein